MPSVLAGLLPGNAATLPITHLRPTTHPPPTYLPTQVFRFQEFHLLSTTQAFRPPWPAPVHIGAAAEDDGEGPSSGGSSSGVQAAGGSSGSGDGGRASREQRRRLWQGRQQQQMQGGPGADLALCAEQGAQEN